MALYHNVVCYLGDHDRPDILKGMFDDALAAAEKAELPSALITPETRSITRAFAYGGIFAHPMITKDPLAGFMEWMRETREHLATAIAERFDAVVQEWVESNRARIAAIDQMAIARAIRESDEFANMNARRE